MTPLAFALVVGIAGQAGPAWSGFEDLHGFDKVEHAGVNIMLTDGAWAAAAMLHAPLWARVTAGVATSAAVSLGKELWDAAGHGDPSLGDLTFDALGIGAGVGFALAVEALAAQNAADAEPLSSPAARVP